MKIQKSKVELVSISPNAEQTISYCARVSNPTNQENYDTAPKLLKYCIDNKHWSVFEMSNLCIQIKTDRATARQILRHKSFSFQEFSQRYATVTEEPIYAKARRQDKKNRQNSVDDISDEDQKWFQDGQKEIWELTQKFYNEALDKGIAKECARAVLPEGISPSTLYVNGNIRSWITYLTVRMDKSTQLEHREIAELIIKEIFIPHFPEISKAMGWIDG